MLLDFIVGGDEQSVDISSLDNLTVHDSNVFAQRLRRKLPDEGPRISCGSVNEQLFQLKHVLRH